MGNIIGESLDDYVGQQIKKRQKILGKGNAEDNLRSLEDIMALNSNAPWVKLASGTSLKEERLALLRPNNPMLDNVTEGFDLAKKNILSQGLSSLSPTTPSTADGGGKSPLEYILQQRQGMTGKDKAIGVGGTEYGFSPMPGITDVNIQSLNRGSLKKATITIKAFNPNQFNVIDALYMRLGYTVLLEWGHSKYYPNKLNSSVTEMGPTLIEREFFGSRLGNSSYDKWLPLIEKERRNTSGNYDALFGIVSNFNWQFGEDGSYTIQITLMSMGDVMESFKVNVPSFASINLKKYLDSATGITNIVSEIGDNIEARKLDFTKHIDNLIYDNPTTVEELEGDNDHDVDESSANSAGYYYFDAYGSGGTSGDVFDASEKHYFGMDITGSKDIKNTAGVTPPPQFTLASRYRERTGKSIYDLEVFEEDDMVNNNHWFFILDAVELWDLVYTSGLDIKNQTYNEALKEHVQTLTKEDEELFEFVQGEVAKLKESKLKALLFDIREIATKEKKNGKKISYGVKHSSQGQFRKTEIGQVLDYNEDQKEKYVKVGLPPTNPDHGSTSDIISTEISIGENKGSIAYYIRLGSLLKYLETHILFKILPSQTPFMYIDTDIKKNIMYTIPNQLSTDPRVCLIQNLNFNKGGDVVCSFWDTLENFSINVNDGINYGQVMNIYINFNHIENILTSDKKLNLFRFFSTLCNDINSSLGNVNNLEPVIDELTNTIKIIEQTSIPGIEEIMRELKIPPSPDPAIIQVYGYDGDKGNFVKNIGLKTEITKEYATMITIGATANGYIPGEEATAFSKWNMGIEDRFKPDLGDADEGEILPTKAENFERTNEAVKENYVDYQGLDPLEIIGLNKPTPIVPTYNISEDKISSNASTVENFNKYLQASASLASPKAEGSTGFLPFNLSLTINGISGIKIYNQLEVNTNFLPSNYPETLKFIVTAVDHSLSTGWETKINTIATSKGRIEGSLITLSSFSSTISRVEEDINLEKRLNSGTTDTVIVDNESQYGTKGQNISVDTLVDRLNIAYRDRFRSFLNEFINNKRGYKLLINATYRTLKRSAELKQQNAKNASPGKSAHNYGVGLDFNLIIPDGDILRKKENKEIWLKTEIVDMAIRNELQWGGNYSSYKDYIHFYIKEWNPNNAIAAKSKLDRVYGLGNNPSMATYIAKNPDGKNPQIDLPNVLS